MSDYFDHIDPVEGDWAEAMRDSADLLRKQRRESPPVVLTDRDTGDETDYEDAA